MPTTPTAAIESGACRVFCTVTFPFEKHRLAQLADTLAAISGWHSAASLCAVLLDTAATDAIGMVSALARRFGTPTARTSVISRPDLAQDRAALAWAHKTVMQDALADTDAAFTHFLHLDAGVLFNERALRYFLTTSPALKPFGLRPGFLPCRFDKARNDIVSAAQPLDTPYFSPVTAGRTFMPLVAPYAGCFMLERGDMAQHLRAPSSRRQEDRREDSRITIEKASVGVSFERIPPGFPSCLVTPLQPDGPIPDADCWLWQNDTYAATRATVAIDRLYSGQIPTPLVTLGDKTPGNEPALTPRGELFPATRYPRPAPVLAAPPDVAETVQAQYEALRRNDAEAPASNVTQIDELIVWGETQYARLNGRYAVILESLPPGKRVSVPPVASLDALDATDIHPIPPQADAIDILLSTPDDQDPDLWLTATLPTALLAAVLGRQKQAAQKIRLFLPSVNGEVDVRRRNILALALSEVRPLEILFLPTDQPFRFRGLYCPTPAAQGRALKNTVALDAISRTIQAHAGAQPAKRLFLHDPDGQDGLLNARELLGELAQAGFETVPSGADDILARLTALSNAEMIVGSPSVMGAAALFAPQGCRTVLLSPAGREDAFHWDMAAARRQRHAEIRAPTTGLNHAQPDRPHFMIASETIKALLAHLGTLPEPESSSNGN